MLLDCSGVGYEIHLAPRHLSDLQQGCAFVVRRGRVAECLNPQTSNMFKMDYSQVWATSAAMIVDVCANGGLQQ